MAKKIYLLKTQGTSKIPDYIQIRDEHFVLMAHNRADKPQTAIEAAGLTEYAQALMAHIGQLPYGEIQLIDL